MSDDAQGQDTLALGNVHRLRRKGIKEAAAAKGAEEETGQGEMMFLPGDCTVVPIGYQDDEFYYLDNSSQLRRLKAGRHVRLEIQALFGDKMAVLRDYWPRRTKIVNLTGETEWIVTGWKPELAAEALMSSASRCGVWSAEEKERGSGAWKGPDGELILHCGNELIMADLKKPLASGPGWKTRKPGIVDGLVYPTAPAAMKPHPDPQKPGAGGPGAELLALLQTWNWRRKEIDAYLLLGWIGAAMVCGALDWRPMVWVTGDKNTGKSTLQGLIKHLLGERGLVDSADATAASVRQVIGASSRPVAMDETESDDNNRKLNEMIKLARVAASGARALRGSSDHKAVTFTLRSAFLFSSILIPSLETQDRSRLAILELDAIEASGMPKPAALTPRRMGELGQKLLRRMVGQWYRLGESYELYREALRAAGHDSRRQDCFGILLACADCLMRDCVPDAEVLAGWGDKLRADTLAEVESDRGIDNACLNFLLSTMAMHAHDREQMAFGQWIARAAGIFDAGQEVEDWQRCERANKLLVDHGMKVMPYERRQYLAVANVHRGISKIFENTKWAARPGAAGVWVQALRRVPGHVVPKQVVWFGGPSRATLLPLALCIEDEELRQAPPPLPFDPDDPPERGEF